MSDTKTRLLDAAADLAQTRGFNGFSFNDLAEAVGIKTASIHYHFPTKAKLGQQLISRYADDFMASLGAADSDTPEACLARYVGLFRETLGQGRMCLCGMVGAEIAGVPKLLAPDVQTFFDRNCAWLTEVIARSGKSQPGLRAEVLLATLEGAMLMARVANDPARFDPIAHRATDTALRSDG
jgi:TetR/AcrR family transcriptional repressor of nem operon